MVDLEMKKEHFPASGCCGPFVFGVTGPGDTKDGVITMVAQRGGDYDR